MESSTFSKLHMEIKKLSNPSTAKHFIINSKTSDRDEAHNGRAFEGLLARYFK